MPRSSTGGTRPSTTPVTSDGHRFDPRDLGRRALAVTAAATLVACGVVALLDREVFRVPVLLICVALHPLLTAAAATWAGRRGPWDPTTARWRFAGVMTGCSLAVLVLLSVVTATWAAVTDPMPGPTGRADTFGMLAFALVAGVCLSGLPLWTLLAAVLVGPGASTPTLSTARRPRR